MRCRSLILWTVVLFTGVMSVAAQPTAIPKEGSAERKAILNAMRVPVEKDLKQKVVFVVDHIKTQGSWAFVSGRPQNRRRQDQAGRHDVRGARRYF